MLSKGLTWFSFRALLSARRSEPQPRSELVWVLPGQARTLAWQQATPRSGTTQRGVVPPAGAGLRSSFHQQLRALAHWGERPGRARRAHPRGGLWVYACSPGHMLGMFHPN